MGFRLSREAEEDIITIAEYGISVFGTAQAERYHTELLALIGPPPPGWPARGRRSFRR